MNSSTSICPLPSASTICAMSWSSSSLIVLTLMFALLTACLNSSYERYPLAFLSMLANCCFHWSTLVDRVAAWTCSVSRSYYLMC